MKKPTMLTLSARIENLNRFQTFISGHAHRMGMTMDRVRKLQLASEEALVNIINYAYPEDEPGDITVFCHNGPNREIRIVFEDTGKAFDMLSVEEPDTNLSLKERKIGGLGVFFIRRMTDGASYLRKDGKNILSLRMGPG